MKSLLIPKLFTHGNINMDKKLLRKEIKSKRALLSESYKKESSEKITEAVISSTAYIRADSIFIYISSPDEPATNKIINAALGDGKKVYVPKCIAKGLMLPVEINRKTVFVSGYMGILEPAEYNEDIKIPKIDLSIIPCVSASLSGERLGHGAAFYDIFLQHTETEKFCLCFHKLIQESIPTESTDIKMNAVITEKGIFTVKQSKKIYTPNLR